MDDILLDYLLSNGVLTDIVESGANVDNGGISLDDAMSIVDWSSTALDMHIAAQEADLDPNSDLWVR